MLLSSAMNKLLMINRNWLPIYIALLLFITVGCHTAVSSTSGIYALMNTDGRMPTLKVIQPLDQSVTRSNSILVSGITDSSSIVEINDVVVEPDGNRFSYQLSLEPGPNCINVSAQSPSGVKTITNLTVVYIP